MFLANLAQRDHYVQPEREKQPMFVHGTDCAIRDTCYRSRPMIPLAWALLLALVPGAEPMRPPGDFAALGGEIVARVEADFLDAGRARAWAASHRDLGAGITDPDAFARSVRRALEELATSHTGYYRDTDAAYWDLLAIFERTLGRDPSIDRIGAAFVSEGGSWFVERTFAGGPAETAGLRRGDRVVAAGGAPFDPQRSLTSKDGWPLALEIERRPGAAPITVSVVPRRVNPAQEWLDAQRGSSRLVEVDGHRVGETTIHSCAGEAPMRLLEDQIQSDLAEAEALVVDLRGGWGGCDLRFVALFDDAVPRLTSRDRDGSESTFAPTWRKPVVLLVDGGSRSGKEVVARALQRSRRARLVGTRTAGAVVAGRPFLLSDGSLLYLAVRDIDVDGERLEGLGVAPDVVVPGGLAGADGADPQRDAARALAARLARKLKRAGR
jgi:carboxyl-terminal processing protease